MVRPELINPDKAFPNEAIWRIARPHAYVPDDRHGAKTDHGTQSDTPLSDLQIKLPTHQFTDLGKHLLRIGIDHLQQYLISELTRLGYRFDHFRHTTLGWSARSAAGLVTSVDRCPRR